MLQWIIVKMFSEVFWDMLSKDMFVFADNLKK